MGFKAIRSASLFVRLFFVYLFGNIGIHVPCLKRAIVKQMDRVASIVMPVGNYWHTLFTWPMMKTLWKYGQYEIYKSSEVGHAAPNPRLVCADCKEAMHEVNLYGLVNESRPLIVVFGSWTCPVFVEKMNKLHEVHQEFAAVADFIAVYVQEAHPEDGWRMENNYVIPKHRSMKERIKASQIFRSLLNNDIPLYIDSIGNEASKAYSGCPNRILVIKGNTLVYENGPGPTFYNFDGLRKKLKEM